MYYTYTINILIFSYFKFRYKQIAWLRRPTSALKENVSMEFKSTLYRNPYKEQQRPYTTPARPTTSDADAQPKQGRGTATSSGGGAGPRRRPGARLVEDDRREQEQEEEDDDHQNQEEEEEEADAK